MNGFTPSTGAELLKELQLNDRVKALAADVADIEADQRIATGMAYQKALADIGKASKTRTSAGCWWLPRPKRSTRR